MSTTEQELYDLVEWMGDKFGYSFDKPTDVAAAVRQIDIALAQLIKPNRATNQILGERERQDMMFGTQNHTPFEWMGILAQEIGEAQTCANDLHFRIDKLDINERGKFIRQLYIQFTKTAAVAQAAMECLERAEYDNAVQFLADRD